MSAQQSLDPVEVAEWALEYEAAGRPQHDCATEAVGQVCGVCARPLLAEEERGR